MKILTTGIGSGLGKYIHETWGAAGLGRGTSLEEWENLRQTSWDVIIHCAFRNERSIESRKIYPYFQDNFLLTEKLTSFPHRKFVFFSSVDVYPKDDRLHAEEESIHLEELDSSYAHAKLFSESIVREKSRDFLILRCTSLLGSQMRRNTLIRILEGGEEPLNLSLDSELNYIRYADVSSFIRKAVEKSWKGIYNLASSSNISLGEAVELIGKRPRFGPYRYEVGRIDNRKAASLFPAFSYSSKEILTRFLAEDWPKRKVGSEFSVQCEQP